MLGSLGKHARQPTRPKLLTYGHKKRAPLSPTFVNLKSNTMKNTLQRYGLLCKLSKQKSMFYNTF